MDHIFMINRYIEIYTSYDECYGTISFVEKCPKTTSSIRCSPKPAGSSQRWPRKGGRNVRTRGGQNDEFCYPVAGRERFGAVGVWIFPTNIPYEMWSRSELWVEFPNHLIVFDGKKCGKLGNSETLGIMPLDVLWTKCSTMERGHVGVVFIFGKASPSEWRSASWK